MYQKDRSLDFHALGEEIKKKRIERGWTQAYLGQLVDRSDRSIMYFENRGKHPLLDVFYKLVTILDISVDKFFFPAQTLSPSENHNRLSHLVGMMTESEIAILVATAEAIIKNQKENEI